MPDAVACFDNAPRDFARTVVAYLTLQRTGRAQSRSRAAIGPRKDRIVASPCQRRFGTRTNHALASLVGVIAIERGRAAGQAVDGVARRRTLAWRRRSARRAAIVRDGNPLPRECRQKRAGDHHPIAYVTLEGRVARSHIARAIFATNLIIRARSTRVGQGRGTSAIDRLLDPYSFSRGAAEVNASLPVAAAYLAHPVVAHSVDIAANGPEPRSIRRTAFVRHRT